MGLAVGRTIGLLVLAARARRCVGEGRAAVRDPLVDMHMMRLRGVWTTNLTGFLIGFGMYSSFVLIPQFVETRRRPVTASARP